MKRCTCIAAIVMAMFTVAGVAEEPKLTYLAFDPTKKPWPEEISRWPSDKGRLFAREDDSPRKSDSSWGYVLVHVKDLPEGASTQQMPVFAKSIFIRRGEQLYMVHEPTVIGQERPLMRVLNGSVR